ncbi:flagellar biosynthetic protein FliO [Porcipelethomonas sp.]|uniref:flagellar biosynthetic protein FliO n=1 Tax=Porcipelethomonas sp. TaxID=2981675 RepID=UPI003EF290DF
MDGKSLISQIGSVLGALIGFAVILYLAYMATKLLGKRLSFKSGSNKNIKILESVSLGQNKALMIVEAADKTMLIGITSGEISLISELDGEKLKTESENAPETMEFSKAFKTVLENNFGKKLKKSKEHKNDNKKG